MGPLVAVSTGVLEGRGSPDGTVRSFLGIPYAAPPVGEQRWRPPAAPEPWFDVRPATAFGPSAPQGLGAANSILWGGEQLYDEDCLYLNVWTGPAPDQGRPVMVWLHYGAFQGGSASDRRYDGEFLARRGVTLVTLNYRLGRLGFMAHPELSAESDYAGSGNYGLMDQIAALRWVQDNIGAFGGDPGNVTVFGVSAGGHSVHYLRASPLAEGLFHRAIAQSGPGVGPLLEGYGHPGAVQDLRSGEEAGVEFAHLVGATSLREMRALPAAEVASAFLPRAYGEFQLDGLDPDVRISLQAFNTSYPIVDGHVLPDAPMALLRSGGHTAMPLMLGTVANEASNLPYLASVEAFHRYLDHEFGALAGDAKSLYPAASDQMARLSSWDLEADRTFNWSTWTAARLQQRSEAGPVFHYLFARAPELPETLLEHEYAGAFHSAEVLYIFGTMATDRWADWPWTSGDRALAEKMASAWVNFAKTGDPNGPGVPYWPTFDESQPSTMEWDIEPRVAPVRRMAQLSFLDKVHGF